MRKPLVSIIIPVYNGANYLKEAIDSALNQTYDNCEVIVVNDGSDGNGDTEKIALSYKDKIKYLFKPNGGVAQALNCGISEMQGEYFSWLSHDDRLYPEKIEKEMRVLTQSNAAIVFCSYNILYEDGKRTLVMLTDHYDRNQLIKGVFPVINSMIQFGGVLFKKEIFDNYGGFREELKTTQDYEFLFRVLKEEKSCYIDEALYDLRHHKSQGSKTIKSVPLEADDMYMMFLTEIEDCKKKEVYGSIYNYYYHMYLNILYQPHLVKSLAECKNKLKSCKYDQDLNESDITSCLNKVFQAGRDIYIYGCGNYGKRLKKDLEFRGIGIAGFIDSNPMLWGQRIEGALCMSLEELKLRAGEILVIIAAIAVSEILNSIKACGEFEVLTKKEIDEASMKFPVDLKGRI